MAGFLERAAAALTPKLASIMRGPVPGLSPGMIVLCFKLLENGRLELRFAKEERVYIEAGLGLNWSK